MNIHRHPIHKKERDESDRKKPNQITPDRRTEYDAKQSYVIPRPYEKKNEKTQFISNAEEKKPAKFVSDQRNLEKPPPAPRRTRTGRVFARRVFFALLECHQTLHLLEREFQQLLSLLQVNVLSDLGILPGKGLDLLG